MKIVVLSDIHGNLPALQAVASDIQTWAPDLVIVNGDIVNRGPLSRDCLHFVQEKQHTHNWQVVSGNHEGFVLACGKPDTPKQGPHYDVAAFAHWAYNQLNGEIDTLAALPSQFCWLAPDGSEFRVTHASMRSNRDGLYQDAKAAELRQQIAPPPAVFVTAHTHRTFIRQLDDTLIVNVGSVGLPFDADPRASYGRFTWDQAAGWQAQIIRLPYDRVETEKTFVDSGFLAEAGPLAQIMLVELRKSHGLMYRWATRYYDRILAQEISVEASVRELLADEDLRPFIGAPGWTIKNKDTQSTS